MQEPQACNVDPKLLQRELKEPVLKGACVVQGV